MQHDREMEEYENDMTKQLWEFVDITDGLDYSF